MKAVHSFRKSFLTCFFLFISISLFSQIYFTGKVYQGDVGVEPPVSKAVENVSVKLYCSVNENQLGTLSGTSWTNQDGWYELEIPAGYEYFNIVLDVPSDYSAVGATTVDGIVVSSTQIQYSVAERPINVQTLTGNKFWLKPEISPNTSPVADAGGPYTGYTGQQLTLDGSGSYDIDQGDNIISYEWDLDGDGNFDDATGQFTYYTWNNATNTTIGLRVTDSNSASDIDYANVTISLPLEQTGSIYIEKQIISPVSPKDSFQISGDLNAVFSISSYSGHDNLKAGTYTIYEINPPGWELIDIIIDDDNSTSDLGTLTAVLNLDAGDTITCTFVNRKKEIDHYDMGDAPDPSYPTLLSSKGARHRIDQSLYLGSSVDHDSEGQPNVNASGDDEDGWDDEDGVVFKEPYELPAYVYSTNVEFSVVASRAGYVNVWCDLDNNGSWAENSDHVINNWSVNPGSNLGGISKNMKDLIGKKYMRFRYSTSKDLSYDNSSSGGTIPDGEVEDYFVELVKLKYADLGDAPDSSFINGVNMYAYPGIISHFPTVWKWKDFLPIASGVNHGPIHWNPQDGIYLGSKVSLEFNADHGYDEDPTHNLDPMKNISDLDLGDDGVTVPLYLPDCEPAYFEYTVSVSKPKSAFFVNVWFDWNRDGDWEDNVKCGDILLPEWAVQNALTNADTSGTYTLKTPSFMSAPFYNGNNGPIWMRITVANVACNNPDGSGPDLGYSFGETEDYYFTPKTTAEYLYDFGDAPDDTLNPAYPTLHKNGGAYHDINPNFLLGAMIDKETDGQPDAVASGDDNNNLDDEDGIVFTNSLMTGQTASLDATASSSGLLNAWIDFNQNESWVDFGEHIISDYPLKPGNNSISYFVPQNARTGSTYARFRFSKIPGLTAGGYGQEGEVEDYQVEIIGGEEPPQKWPQPPGGNPDSPHPDCYWGWDELSVFYLQVAADDWISEDQRPVTDIHWWGSYADWKQTEPPPEAPDEFIIHIWSDAPLNNKDTLAHPGTAIMEYIVKRKDLNESFSGCDFHPDKMNDTESCFLYDLFLPPELWFYPEQGKIYWISIAAEYADFSAIPKNNRWGWKTREPAFRSPAFSIRTPAFPVLGDQFIQGEPIEDNFDLAFLLTTLEDEDQGKSYLKWDQPPLLTRNEDLRRDSCYYGWNETSIWTEQVVADDWYCNDSGPVSDIHWWGSYQGWDSIHPPPIAPTEFHIGIWTNRPSDQEHEWAEPEQVIYEWWVPRDFLYERAVGCDFDPEKMSFPDACFRYDFRIPPDNWFYQEGDSAIYWISIGAYYPEKPDTFLWGWKTREHYFHADAVIINDPAGFHPGVYAEITQPLKTGWDMAFQLTTPDEKPAKMDFGDAPDERYPTLFLSNGAHHLIDEDIFLGSLLDYEADGFSTDEANGDDQDNLGDEDGITFPTPVISGRKNTLEARASAKGYLSAWMDFSNNGSWNEDEDYVIKNEKLVTGINSIEFSVPENAINWPVFTRFRFSTESGLPYYGLAMNGEVEDYVIEFESPGTNFLEENSFTDSQLPYIHPNPFHSETSIEFYVPEEEAVFLSIHDMLGKEITILVNKKIRAGYHSLLWNGTDGSGQKLPAGVYILNYQSGKFGAVRKIILL